MTRCVKIATIGTAPPRMDADLPAQQIVEAMIEHWQERLGQILPDRPDLIVLPEACDRPADLAPDVLRKYYQVRGDQVRDWLSDVARQNRCYIVYSAYRELDDGTWRNSSVVLDRDGGVAGIYNKNHVVIEECANEGVLYGKEAPLIECDFGRIACIICFDLNYDELRLRYARARPDLLVFSSMYHGGTAQAFWAYACRCHFVGAVSDLPCEIRNPYGEVLATGTNYRDYAVADVNLDCCLAHYDYHWDKLRALKDHYGEKVTIYDPGLFGSVMISSLADDVSAKDMAAEFEIQLLDDYFDRARAHRAVPGHIEP